MIEAPPAAAPEPSLASRTLRSTVEWVVIIAGALLIAFVAKTFLIQAFYIPSASMDPTLAIGDRVVVNKLSYRLHEVNRGDIVVFERPPCAAPDPKIKDLIKRVVALPGEKVEGRDGGVVVDGEALPERYLPADQTTSDFGPVTVPAGTFKALRYHNEKYNGDTWVVMERPFFMVKSTGKDFEMSLVSSGDGAKSSITETPRDMMGPGK